MSAHFTIKPPRDANWLDLLNAYADTPWWKQTVATIAEMARKEASLGGLSIYADIAEIANEIVTYRTIDECPNGLDYLRELLGEAEARQSWFDEPMARPAMSYVPGSCI